MMRFFPLKIIFILFTTVVFAQEAVYVRGTGNLDNLKNRIVKIGENIIFNNYTAAYNSLSGRGLALTILDAETHQHISSINYDTFGSSSESDALAQALNNLGKGKIGILTSRDAWESNVTENLRDAALRLGLLKLSLTKGVPKQPYAAIFRGANAEFNNSMVIEVLQPANTNANYAVISTMLIEDSFVGNDISNGLIVANGNKNEIGLSLNHLGNVGIGLENPDSKLTVKGNIHAQEVKVDLNGVIAPDYVFKQGYDLWSIEEIESYINKNGHLPNVPAAEELEQNGLNLKEMNLKLLEKIEELTLYTIEQDKQLKHHEIRERELKKQLSEQRTSLRSLLKRIEILEKE
ncbi:interleukin-like EMT inducer domain-containing protein [Zunongwangia sp.]|uniref:interleukin-like EMT inducer domain-containing protein n=1 Tax=Zunongwangia sp. TaxID=1965325 RepID=UPI003AA7E321